jgi:hypothetical protein
MEDITSTVFWLASTFATQCLRCQYRLGTLYHGDLSSAPFGASLGCAVLAGGDRCGWNVVSADLVKKATEAFDQVSAKPAAAKNDSKGLSVGERLEIL